MKRISLPTGERVPALGQGTWNIGEKKKDRAGEIAALRLGIELGLSLIDTAEMYGDGQSEELIAEAIDGQRQQVFLVSKVLPELSITPQAHHCSLPTPPLVSNVSFLLPILESHAHNNWGKCHD